MEHNSGRLSHGWSHFFHTPFSSLLYLPPIGVFRRTGWGLALRRASSTDNSLTPSRSMIWDAGICGGVTIPFCGVVVPELLALPGALAGGVLPSRTCRSCTSGIILSFHSTRIRSNSSGSSASSPLMTLVRTGMSVLPICAMSAGGPE